MHNNDWSLIFFTLLSQLSVGIIVFLTIICFVNIQQFNSLHSDSLFKTPLTVALLAIAIATVISFFHLGHPAHAFHSVNNLGSSWLSREILGIGMFGTGVLMLFILNLLKIQNQALLQVLLVYSSAAGITLVYFMSRIYMVPTIPAWHTWYTPFHFYLAAFVVGGMVITGFLFVHSLNGETIKWLLRDVAVALLLQLVAAVLYKNHLVKMEHSGIAHPDFESGLYHTLYLVRLFIIFIAALFAAYLSLRTNSIGVTYNAVIRFYAFTFFLIVAEEVIGRFMFYTGYYRIGV
jgi:anaerobic dimethyl sulfoxide reductase subunit C (anchor subunit)